MKLEAVLVSTGGGFSLSPAKHLARDPQGAADELAAQGMLKPVPHVLWG